jgi:hypothetical protein
MVEMSRFRKSHKNRKQGGSRRRQRRQGGAAVGAPLSYQLRDQASAQGADYLSYHEGQHGGANPLALTPLDAIDGSALAGQLRGPAMLGGIDRAFADIAGLRDQQGGKRSKRSKRSKKGGKRSKRSKRSKKGGKRSKRSKKHGKTRRSRRYRRSHGGSLGFAPFPSQGMLLSPGQSARAGLSEGWADAVEFDAAKMRSAE